MHSASSTKLISFRVAEEPVFTYTVVDFAGTLYVKVVGPSTESKTWICLYTCSMMTAIHLDLQFGSRYDCRVLDPLFQKVYCQERLSPQDNGKAFKATPKTDVHGNALSEGDVVLIHSDSKLQGFWKLGRVQRLVKGDDDHVRGAILRSY